jgi:phage terminase small subunit
MSEQPAVPVPAKLSYKQRRFIEAYVTSWNATEAARQAGYKHPNVQGPRMLVRVSIKAAIEQKLKEAAMGADEVLKRLSDIARSDIGDFLDIGSMAFSVDLNKAKEKGITHLIKKVRMRTTITQAADVTETEVHHIEVEPYDAQDALNTLGKHLKLFTDQVELTGDVTVKVIKGVSMDEI